MFQIIMMRVIYCIQGSVWGWAVNKVVENKGYPEICPQKAPDRHNRQMKMYRHRNYRSGTVRPAENK